jgi:hypothetical protein
MWKGQKYWENRYLRDKYLHFLGGRCENIIFRGGGGGVGMVFGPIQSTPGPLFALSLLLASCYPATSLPLPWFCLPSYRPATPPVISIPLLYSRYSFCDTDISPLWPWYLCLVPPTPLIIPLPFPWAYYPSSSKLPLLWPCYPSCHPASPPVTQLPLHCSLLPLLVSRYPSCVPSTPPVFLPVFWIKIQRIRTFLGFPDPDPKNMFRIRILSPYFNFLDSFPLFWAQFHIKLYLNTTK